MRYSTGLSDFPDNPVKSILPRDDRFDLGAFEKGDHSVASVPHAVSRAPDFISIDPSAACEHDDGFASLSFRDSWSTCRDGIGGGA